MTDENDNKIIINKDVLSITTGIGDKGSTRLFSGETVSKASVRTEAYGDLDELVSILGIARSLAEHPRLNETIKEIQRDLFLAGTEMATERDAQDKIPERITERHLEKIDQLRQTLENQIQMPNGFIIPGGTPVGGHLDHARAVSRRVERRIVKLQETGLIHNPELIIWINRLSDTLWLLARQAEGVRMTIKD